MQQGLRTMSKLDEPLPTEKECPGCLEIKPIEEFRNGKNSKFFNRLCYKCFKKVKLQQYNDAKEYRNL
jgi:hypothetical protein